MSKIKLFISQIEEQLFTKLTTFASYKLKSFGNPIEINTRGIKKIKIYLFNLQFCTNIATENENEISRKKE